MPGVLLRSDNLQSLTARDVRVLVEEEALEVVLDLRTELEVGARGTGAHDAGATRARRASVAYPRSGKKPDLDADSVMSRLRLDPSGWPGEPRVVQAYLSYLIARPDSIAASIGPIANARGAVLVHCAAGKDRTGVIVALALDAAGADRDHDRQRLSGDSRAHRRDHGAPGRLAYLPGGAGRSRSTDARPLPGTIERVLALLDEGFGGSAAWLEDHGLSGAELEQLRRRVVSE